MSRVQHICRVVAAAASRNGLAVVIAVPPLLLSTTEPTSATAAPTLSSGCHVSRQPFGTAVALCPTSHSSIVTCSLISLPVAPLGYRRRPPAQPGQEWAAIDCPGLYPFGGVTVIPDGHLSVVPITAVRRAGRD